MKKIIAKIFAVALVVCMLLSLTACYDNDTPNGEIKALAARETNSWEVSSPDGSIKVSLGMDSASNVYYSVVKDSVTVVEKSYLGLDIREDDLSSLTFDKRTTRRIQGEYDNITGKHSTVEYDAMELQVTFKSYQYVLDVYMRAYDDGYAFRYGLSDASGANNGTVKIDAEKSELTIPAAASLWRQKYQPFIDYTLVDVLKDENGNVPETFAYERNGYDYIPASGIEVGDRIGYPILYRPDNDEDVYSLVTESGLIGSGFYGSIVQATSAANSDSKSGLKLQTVPTPAGAIEDDGLVSLPFTSPWRVGITGTLDTVVESELTEKVYDDAEPWKPDNYDELSAEEKEIYNYDWVDPDIAAWSWIVYRAADQKNYAVHKAYLDKAAEMGWKYLLLDGSWAADYVISLNNADSASKAQIKDDGITTEGVPKDMEAFMQYAKTKGIKIIVWADAIRTFGNADYNVLCDVLDKYVAMGVAGVKLDFWDGERQLKDGHQMPNSACEDSANVAWYETVYQECAKRKLLVNCHGSNKPTGERRVYPNVINREGIYGGEMNANTASGTINQLFTRAVIGPSDFTPLVKPMGQQFTTGFMITLPILFEGMTTVGDTMTNLNYAPIQDLYAALPTLRDETKFLCGEPDEYYCAAVRVGDEWFIAGVTDKARNITVDLSFLGEGTFQGFLYEDDGDYVRYKPTAINKSGITVTSSDSKTVTLKQKSGFVIHITKQS